MVEFSKYVDNGNGTFWAGTPEEEQAYLGDSNRILSELESYLESWLDDAAWNNGRWKNIHAAIAAASLAGPFQSQALKLAQLWSDSWAIAIGIMNEVKAGHLAIPTPQELIAMMPVYQP